MLVLAMSAAIGACGDDSGSAGTGGSGGSSGSGRTLPYDSIDRCEADHTEIGCTASPAGKGTTFEDRYVSVTYRGYRSIETSVEIERTFGEPEILDGVEYYVYFDVHLLKDVHWEDDGYGTDFYVEEASRAPALPECLRYGLLPALEHYAKLTKGSTITMRWCLSDPGASDADDAPSAFVLHADMGKLATFELGDQTVDGDALDDVVAGHEIAAKTNEDWSGLESSRAEAIEEAEAAA